MLLSPLLVVLSFRLLIGLVLVSCQASGYKVSALEVERLLLEHPAVDECAIMGVVEPTGVYGEDICMMAVLKKGLSLTLPELVSWAKPKMAAYKLPRRLLLVDDIPKNGIAMHITVPSCVVYLFLLVLLVFYLVSHG